MQSARVTTSARFLSPAKLRKLRASGQVAAVCYRVRDSQVQFLLVRTRGGKWTFPKGGSEPGLTHAQAAALEAFEEAGVHGRIEDVSFARYMLRGEMMVHAYLCEVSRQVAPEESNRQPTWCSPATAKRRLKEGRSAKDGAEFARVVEEAVVRVIGAFNRPAPLAPPASKKDALQTVAFEAAEIKPAIFPQYRVHPAVGDYIHRMLQRSHGTPVRPAKGLLQSSNSSPRMAHVFEIDNPGGVENKSKISTRKNRRNRPTIG